MEKQFKYDLQTIYSEVNRLAKEYQKEGLSDMKKHFILADILEVTEELILNQCQKFLRGKVTEVTVEQLYSIAITEPLMEVLEWHDFSQGENIMINWLSFMEKRFCNAVKKGRTKKAMWDKINVCSSDKPLNEEGTTICDLVGEDDFSEKVCSEISFTKLLNDFEEQDKHGKIIRCLLIGKQEPRRKAFLEVLGAETYGHKQRKDVQRVKERFVKFLIKNNYDLAGYDIKKFL